MVWLEKTYFWQLKYCLVALTRVVCPRTGRHCGCLVDASVPPPASLSTLCTALCITLHCASLYTVHHSAVCKTVCSPLWVHPSAKSPHTHSPLAPHPFMHLAYFFSCNFMVFKGKFDWTDLPCCVCSANYVLIFFKVAVLRGITLDQVCLINEWQMGKELS